MNLLWQLVSRSSLLGRSKASGLNSIVSGGVATLDKGEARDFSQPSYTQTLGAAKRWKTSQGWSLGEKKPYLPGIAEEGQKLKGHSYRRGAVSCRHSPGSGNLR